MNKFLRIKIHCLLLTLFLTSCSEVPDCHFKENRFITANAGCLVLHKQKLLFVEDYKGRLSFPGGGGEKNEAAQCTAEREVWEETGINVKAHSLYTVFENNFHLYECELSESNGEIISTLDGSDRPWRFEVNGIYWLGVDDFDGKDWRFPDQVLIMKKYLNKKGKSNE